MNLKEYIPLDKSWIIRMGVLDIVHGKNDIVDFLNTQADLGDDLLALRNVALTWKDSQIIDVGESGTLYRLLKFASWKLALGKSFITKGTLKNRNITDNPEIVSFSQSELLKLDNGTSQWATAAVLVGDSERMPNPPYKLQVTYDTVFHWNEQRKANKSWEARLDQTILRQVQTYLKLLDGEKVGFIPEQAEDFCFAYTFDYISAEEGEKRWPSLRGHESDRIEEMQTMFQKAKKGEPVNSKDHRVVQALAMWGKVHNRPMNILYPDVVNKSWPQFWKFLDKSSET